MKYHSEAKLEQMDMEQLRLHRSAVSSHLREMARLGTDVDAEGNPSEQWELWLEQIIAVSRFQHILQQLAIDASLARLRVHGAAMLTRLGIPPGDPPDGDDGQVGSGRTPSYKSEAKLESMDLGELAQHRKKVLKHMQEMQRLEQHKHIDENGDEVYTPAFSGWLSQVGKVNAFEKRLLAQGNGMSSHSKHHSVEHMDAMRKAMAQGHTFDGAHTLAMQQVGRGRPRLARELSKTQYRVR